MADRTIDVLVRLETLSVTHICDGEEVITGGEDGQVYIGTFVDAAFAAALVRHAHNYPDRVLRGTRVDCYA